jgi:hypothetical protein
VACIAGHRFAKLQQAALASVDDGGAHKKYYLFWMLRK